MYEILGGDEPGNNVKISENLFVELDFDFFYNVSKSEFVKKYLTNYAL